jgi:hypothetical protein
MSYKKLRSVLLGAAGVLYLASLFLLPSRAWAGQQELAASIAETRTELMNTKEQLKVTLEAIKSLVNQKSGDLKPAFDTFMAELTKTSKAAEATTARGETMQANAISYFESWQKDVDAISNANLHMVSQNRLNKVKKIYDQVVSELKNASSLFKPCMTDLIDISKALSNDLTVKGISSIGSVFRDARSALKSVSGSIDLAMLQAQLAEKTLSSTVEKK